MIFDVLITILLTCFIYCIIKYYQFFQYWQWHSVKSMKGVMLSWAFMPFEDFLKVNYKRFGNLFGAYGFNVRYLFINDPELVNKVSIKQLHEFPHRFLTYLGKNNLKHSLFFMPIDSDWKRIRSIVSPVFTSGKLKRMIPLMEGVVRSFIQHIKPFSETGETFDIQLYTNALVIDILSCCIFGIELDSLNQPDHALVKSVKKILRNDTPLSLLISFTFPNLAKILRLEPFDKPSLDYIDNLTFKIIEKRLESGQIKNKKDLISLMIEQANEIAANNDKQAVEEQTKMNGKLKGISKEEIAGQGLIFYLAGFDTTNSTLCHCIYHLIKYPEWQSKLYAELTENELLIDFDYMKNLPILNAIIDETLRLYPPLLIIQRSNTINRRLYKTDLVVPAHTSLMIAPSRLQRDPNNFPDPDEFKPERFLSDSSTKSHPAYIPFGVGPRQCVAMRFALMELRMSLALLVTNYEILPNPNLKMDYFNGNVLMAPKDLKMQIKPRNHH